MFAGCLQLNCHGGRSFSLCSAVCLAVGGWCSTFSQSSYTCEQQGSITQALSLPKSHSGCSGAIAILTATRQRLGGQPPLTRHSGWDGSTSQSSTRFSSRGSAQQDKKRPGRMGAEATYYSSHKLNSCLTRTRASTLEQQPRVQQTNCSSSCQTSSSPLVPAGAAGRESGSRSSRKAARLASPKITSPPTLRGTYTRLRSGAVGCIVK